MLSARLIRYLAPMTTILAAWTGVPGGGRAIAATGAAAHPAVLLMAETPGSANQDTTPPPGIDLGKLDDFERKVFFRVINREASACGKGHSLIYSVKHDAACRASVYAVRYVVRLVDSGFTDSEIAEMLEKRFRTPRIPNIDVSTAPSKGAASGRVSVVEFVDYECPHCKHAQTLMRQLVEEYPKDVKVYFKHFPLSQHTNARLAAEAAVAAQKQGKFWAYSDKMWANSESLTPAVIEKSATEIGLNMTRFKADLGSEAAKDRVQQDKALGTELGVNSTPSIYINGRKYTDNLEIVSLKDWIDEELGR
jgi:thiol-disulfide isomerase/thioredoxin